MNRKLLRRMHQLRSRLQDKSAANHQRAVQAVEQAEQALLAAQDSLRGNEIANGVRVDEIERRTLLVRQREREVTAQTAIANERQRELTVASIETRRAELLRDQAIAAFRQADAKVQQKLQDDLSGRKDSGT